MRASGTDIDGSRTKSGPPASPHPESVCSAAKLPPFFDLPEFGAAIAELATEAAGDALAAPGTRLLFTAHSLPVAGAQRYVAAVTHVAQRVAGHLGVSDWTLAYQSRSGSPRTPWLEPDVTEALRALADAGAVRVVVVPIGFVSDHVEVLWDLDREASDVAAGLGVALIRTPTVGTHPGFVRGLAARIAAALDDPSVGCAADCCPAPRRPTRGNA